MVEFAYNNAKNDSIGHIFFELNCSYHLCVFLKKNINAYYKSKLADELTNELKNLMTIC